MTFDSDEFVAQCLEARAAPDPPTAVREVVAAVVGEGAGIDAALGLENATFPSALFESDELTVQRITWWPGYRSQPHEHRMWAVVGVYVGVEVNRLYRRSAAGLEAVATHEGGVGDVIALDETAIHSVENPLRTRTAGLHVYGGDIITRPRSAWGPDGKEQPFEEHSRLESAMFFVARQVSTDAAIDLDDETKYSAMQTLVAERERVGRHLTDAEARALICKAWGLPHG
jgi:predicted metal-dependent enzyme (double-stranded beta helix superfamily)